jgi:hypothetical protein
MLDLIWSENWSYYKRRPVENPATKRSFGKEKRRAVVPRGASSLEVG